MQKEIQIGSRRIGEGHPVFIMAECGVTCNYDVEQTKELIDCVKRSGADAIKLIFFFPDELLSDHSLTYTYNTADGERTENMFEMFSDLKFTLDEWQEVKRYADGQNVILFASVHSPSGIEYTEKLDLSAYKLSSWDFNHLPFWREVARQKKPMLIDTGPVFTEDVAKVLAVLREEGNDQAALVHCYHTDEPSEFNMRAIPYMRNAFNVPVGFSAKDTSDEMDIIAVTLGASMIEKRLTLDRTQDGHHHILSKEPDEFQEWAKLIRDVEASLGSEALRPSRADLEARDRWFRRLVVDEDVPAGTVLRQEMLAGKRPGDGISPEHIGFFLGRELKRDLKRNEPLSWDDV